MESKETYQVKLLTIADLPGIIEGAHEGRGLGFQFLRHIERTKILCFVLDMNGSKRTPWQDYEDLRNELNIYNPQLLQRKAIVVANKMDLKGASKNLVQFTQLTGIQPIPISAKEKLNLDQLRQVLCSTFLECIYSK